MYFQSEHTYSIQLDAGTRISTIQSPHTFKNSIIWYTVAITLRLLILILDTCLASNQQYQSFSLLSYSTKECYAALRIEMASYDLTNL